jgi:transposase
MPSSPSRAVRSGGTWRQLPHDVPPWQTVYYSFRTGRRDGTLETVHARLRDRRRRALGRASTPSAAISASQSVKTTERGALPESRRPSAMTAASRCKGASAPAPPARRDPRLGAQGPAPRG